MTRAFGIAGALAVLAAGLCAETTAEQDRMVINPLSGRDFEVVEDITYGAAEFWCGAATYVERRNGLPGNTAIYVKKPRGASVTAPGRKAVVFTLDPRGLPQDDGQRFSLTVDTAGVMLSAVRARSYCRDAFTRSTK
ncbi:MAG: hypothetical protein AAF755_08255 [Pseudomonadota bacterium]